MVRKSFTNVVSDWSAQQRIERAELVIEALTHALDQCLMREASNRHVVYGDTLGKQIPTSRAVHAYNQIQDDLHAYTVIRLLALWDKPAENALSVPTALALIDCDEAIEVLEEGVRQHYRGLVPRNLNPHPDPEIRAAADDLLARNQRQWADEQAAENTTKVRDTLAVAKKIIEDDVTAQLRNLRDARSHSLEYLRRYGPSREPSLPKYGDENSLLQKTIEVVQILYATVNGASYDLSESTRELCMKRADEFWNGLSFSLPVD